MFKIINQHDCGVSEINIPNFKDDRGIFNKAYNYNDFIDLGINFLNLFRLRRFVLGLNERVKPFIIVFL